MQPPANPQFTDLERHEVARFRLAFHTLYQRAIEAGRRIEAQEEQERQLPHVSLGGEGVAVEQILEVQGYEATSHTL